LKEKEMVRLCTKVFVPRTGKHARTNPLFYLRKKRMPFDSHSHLLSQGWTGKGTGLRQGAIAKPIAFHHKKNLAGLGKDRDDAFPFWDQ